MFKVHNTSIRYPTMIDGVCDPFIIVLEVYGLFLLATRMKSVTQQCTKILAKHPEESLTSNLSS